ncbi:STT3 domain-containing protein [Stetteria hydrogenophila]
MPAGKQKRTPVGRESGRFYERLLSVLSARSGLLTAATLAAILAIGVYLRILPALKYKLELDANDPWIAYWLAKYFTEKGLFSFSGLRDVKEFWYPTGRDFLRTESIGIPWLAAATYPIGKAAGLTLREWLALFPVFAGAAAILTSFLLAYKLTGSRLAGLVSAFSMAVAPAAIVRTTVGFVEKIGFSTPFLALMYYFLYSAYTSSGSKRLAYAILAGATGGFIGWIWGGIHLAVATLATVIALDPLMGGPSLERFSRIHLPASLALILVSGAYPAVGFSYYVAGVGLLVPGALLLYATALALKRWLGAYKASFHVWLILVAVAAGVTAVNAGLVSVPGRIAAALGAHTLSPLVTSVQEHQPTSLRSLISDAGFPLFLALLGMAYDLYLAARARSLSAQSLLRLTIYLTLAFTIYASMRMSYFTQLVGFYAATASGFIVGLLLQQRPEAGGAGKKKAGRAEQGIDPLRLISVVLIVMVVATGGIAHAMESYLSNSLRAPAIMTSMLPTLLYSGGEGGQRIVVPLNDAWIDALEWIRENTPENALIVSWWDYGYWITVNTGRPTVADGATFNESRIRLLALVLTGTEDEASALLPLLGAKPNETYIVVYDAFNAVIDEKGFAILLPMFSAWRSPVNPNEYFVVHGRGDLPKSYQMLRIAWRVDPYNSTPFTTEYSTTTTDASGRMYHHYPGYTGEPRENAEKVRNTLIFKMVMHGLQHILDKGVPGAHCEGLLDNATIAIPAVYAGQGLGATPVVVDEFKRFTLEAVVYDCINGTVNRGALTTQASFVAVFIYKWNG